MISDKQLMLDRIYTYSPILREKQKKTQNLPRLLPSFHLNVSTVTTFKIWKEKPSNTGENKNMV